LFVAIEVCVNDKPSHRKDCGYPGIPKAECLSKNCCWDDSIAGVKWCFYKTVIGHYKSSWVMVYSVVS